MSSQKHTTNPTRIQEIDKSSVSLRIDRNNSGEIERLSLNSLDLSGLQLPSDARISIIGKARDSEITFDGGTVANRRIIFDERLHGIDKRHPFHVRVLVFNESDKRILASCERLSAYESEEGSLQSLLPVEPMELGEQLWRVAIPDGERPILEVSNDVHLGMLDRIKNDPMTQALVLPEAIGRALEHLLRSSGDIDEQESWQGRWVRYLESIGVELPEIEDDASQTSATATWVTDTVRIVAQKLKLKSKALSSLPGDTE
jgi:hypothetical protein